ncbi:MAG: HD domain-containing protein [Nitrospirae bacterium]|nr:HD domain-containing protein [Nitrospirota bacterium]
MNSLKSKTETQSGLDRYVRDNLKLMDSLPHSVFITDTDFNIVFSNTAMQNLFGNNGNFHSAKCHQWFHHSDIPAEDRAILVPDGKMKDEQRKIYDAGLNKHLQINSSPLVRDENLIGIIHSVTDISEIKRSEEGHKELIEIYASAINDIKKRQIKAQTGREAFFNMLEDLNESFKELEDLFLKLVRVMVNALDAKSPWTKGHSERVSMYAGQIAKEMMLDDDEIKNIRLAGLLHDIGKIGTDDFLLDKPGALTREEFEVVRKHPAQGAEILKGIKQLKDIVPLIKHHHEKLDGTGYPDRLNDGQIPLGAKILHVADSFDSMTSDRPYRPAPGTEYALSELHKYKGKQFDPAVVEAFLRVLEKRRGNN